VSGGAVDRYRALVAGGELRPDSDQEAAALALGRLEETLEARKSGLLARIFRRREPPICGVYLWGGVGRGKSMLMDLAFEQIEVTPKRRVHFHEFMIEVHARLRTARDTREGDPVPYVVEAIASGARLLAFDEMVINNPADAMILSRLFAQLLDAGVTVVTTSNRPPADLYKDGLNRELFLPFIALIERRMKVLSLNGPCDYRLQRLAGVATWHVPNGPAATAALSDAFFRLTDFPVEDREACAVAGPGPRRRANVARAQEPQGCRRLLVQAPVRRGARRRRLPRHRAAVSHGRSCGNSEDGAGESQRGRAFRDADRRAVRTQGQAARGRRRPAGGTVY